MKRTPPLARHVAPVRVGWRDHPRLRAGPALGVACALLAWPLAAVEGQGIGYTLTPAVQRFKWENSLGLTDQSIYGAQGSIDFEKYLSLQAYFLTGGGLNSTTGPIPGTPVSLVGQDLDLRSYGANVLVNLGTGTLIPFLKAGGGVLDFRPEDGASEPSKQIALNAGGGLRLNIGGRAFLDLSIEDAMFRVDRFSLLGVPPGTDPTTIPADPEADELRHNVVFGAGLGIPFGPARQGQSGTTPSQLYSWGLSGTSFAIEPMYGRLFFEGGNNSEFPDTDIAGVRAGFDIGKWAGISGFYMRDAGDGLDTSADLQSWGGEAQFRLNSGAGITPFLLIGGASVDFRNALGEPTTGPLPVPGDKTSFILGGGIAFPFGERVALQATARDFAYSTTENEAISSPSDLTHNWLVSAGLRFNIGGKSGSSAAKDQQKQAAAAQARADSLAQVAAAQQAAARLIAQAHADSLARLQDSLARLTAAGKAPTDTIKPKTDTVKVAAAAANDSAARAAQTAASAAEQREAMRMVIRDEMAERDRIRAAVFAERAGQYPMPYPMIYPMPVSYPGAYPGQPTGYGAATDPRVELLLQELMRQRGLATTPPAGTTPPRSEVRIPTSKQQPRVSTGEVVPPSPQPQPQPQPQPDSTAARDTMAAPPAAAPTSTDEMRALRDSLRVDLRTELDRNREAGAAAVTRLETQMESMNVRLSTIETRQLEAMAAKAAADSAAAAKAAADSIAAAEKAAKQRAGGIGLAPQPWTFYAGMSITSGWQTVLGARYDLMPLTKNLTWLRVVPELALGLFNGTTSWMGAGNLQAVAPHMTIGGLPFRPFAEAGVGFLRFDDEFNDYDSGTDFVVNIGFGATVDLKKGEGLRPQLFVAEQGIDVFNVNRLLIGLKMGF